MTTEWAVGNKVQLELTLVTTDSKNLGCAMAEEVNGKYCAFLTQNKRNTNSENNPRREANLLQPYTSVDRRQFMASGLWMTTALKSKLDKEDWNRPSPRFTVNCILAIDGLTKSASVQWKPGEGWHNGNGWYVGTLSDCRMQ